MKIEEIFDVQGRVAVITGGADGIGLAFAKALGDNGATVIIIDRNAEAAERAAKEISAAGQKVSFEVADVTDQQSMNRAVNRIIEQHGRLDALFANVGMNPGPGFLTPSRTRSAEGAIDAISMETWHQAVDVNLHGMYRTIRAVVPQMKKQGGGCITLTTSVAATKTSPTVGTPYMPTKAAVAHLSRQLARELAVFGIRVNAIQPGPFRTRMTTPELAKVLSPTGRIGEPEEMEGLALFFASDASSFVTGAQFTIDGGSLLGQAD